ncbi:MAG TPA: hypothetical protein ENJ09_06020, partial [Planctomycetes bacterium]|nr:hypothetical protein [Planctomycetota bacterium]
MAVRQEKLVFAATIVVLGAMSWGLFAPRTTRRRSSRSGERAELVHQRAPDVSLARPNGVTPALERALFAPPRDTHPLPPLELVEPPLETAAVLLPPRSEE